MDFAKRNAEAAHILGRKFVDANSQNEQLRIALREMLQAFSMENVGIDASRRRLKAKALARAALAENPISQA